VRTRLTLLVSVLGAACGQSSAPAPSSTAPPVLAPAPSSTAPPVLAPAPSPTAPTAPTAPAAPATPPVADPSAAFGEIGAIISRAHTEADGRKCETEIVRAACALAYKTHCHRDGAPDLAFWYQLEVSIAAIDLAHIEVGVGLSDHPGHAAIAFTTAPGAIRMTTDDGAAETGAAAALGLGVGKAAEADAARLRTLLIAVAPTCR
jgi:hypothetical protein